MLIHSHPIGVCSWSLRTDSIAEMAAGVRSLGLEHVQLALGHLVFLDDKQKHRELGDLRASGLTVTAGMIGFHGEDYTTIPSIRRTGGFVPDEHWTLRKRIAIEAGKLAGELSISMVSTHIGFVPHKGTAGYQTMIDRTREVADAFAGVNVSLLLETGQESAGDLVSFLDEVDRKNVGVNFDPANMILYGAGDPIAAIHQIGSRIAHVHVKDANASSEPGDEWGDEVVFGRGQVHPAAFLKALHEIGYTGPLVIEREAGENHANDVREAIEALRIAEGEQIK
jgi:L-ribulose-5-phosphate 3-epimerase